MSAFCYVGILPCPENTLKHQDVSEFIRDGYIVERHPVEAVRQKLHRCIHKKTQEELPLDET